MKKHTILFLFISFLIQAPVFSQSILAGKFLAIASTGGGKVKGYIHQGVYTYKGIPYATADRFTSPQKPKPWALVRSSMTYGAVCPTDPVTTVNDESEFSFQHDLGYPNEQCQSLNIWTQKIKENRKRPVMVWLHGGGFTAGSSIELPSYDGENLCKKGDVVIVSINHRLNILGFLDLSAYGDKYKSSANAGMLDIQIALQWVKDNIAEFGGDPENVTIFGQSGGGGKVTCLMNAPSAKGLFQKAIVQSGSYLTAFTEKSVTRQIAAAVLSELKLKPEEADSLQKIPYSKLNAAGKAALQKVSAALKAEGKPSNIGWGPSLDGLFLPYQPTEQAAIELSKNIPLLVGSTKNEFTPFNPSLRNITAEQLETDLQKKYGDKTAAYKKAVLKAYPEVNKPSGYEDIDLNFRAGVIRQANAKAIAGAAPVYMYLFTWQSPVNDSIYKAMHCMDIAFQFSNIERCQEMTGGGKDAYALADKISSAWINFAGTGNPNTSSLPHWPAYTPAGGATMIFNNRSLVRNHPDEDLQKFAN